MKFKIEEIFGQHDSGKQLDSTDNTSLLRKVYGNELRSFVLKDKGDNIVASFYTYAFNKLWQKHIITPPFLTDIQLQVSCSATNASQISNFYRDIITSIADYLKALPHSYMELVLPTQIKDGLPFTWNGFGIGVRYTYLADLNLSDTELLQNMSSQRRKNIRDAEKSNLKVKQVKDKSIIFSKATETLLTKNAKFNKQIVSNISQLAHSNDLVSMGIFDNGELVALSTCLLHQNQSTYLFGWNNGEKGKSYLGTYALWSCILESKNHVSTFNFAGSKIPSVEKYFRGFGGQLTPLISLVSDKRKLTKQFT